MLCRILEYFAGYDKAKVKGEYRMLLQKLLWPRVAYAPRTDCITV